MKKNTPETIPITSHKVKYMTGDIMKRKEEKTNLGIM
jgi:hypothetical protein